MWMKRSDFHLRIGWLAMNLFLLQLLFHSMIWYNNRNFQSNEENLSFCLSRLFRILLLVSESVSACFPSDFLMFCLLIHSWRWMCSFAQLNLPLSLKKTSCECPAFGFCFIQWKILWQCSQQFDAHTFLFDNLWWLDQVWQAVIEYLICSIQQAKITLICCFLFCY